MEPKETRNEKADETLLFCENKFCIICNLKDFFFEPIYRSVFCGAHNGKKVRNHHFKTRALSSVHLRTQIQLFAASQLLKGAM